MTHDQKSELIMTAIKKQLTIEFDYLGSLTDADPYILGLSRMGDDFLYGLTFHQDGDHFYRFDLDKIDNVKLTNTKFNKKTSFKQPEYINETYAYIGL